MLVQISKLYVYEQMVYAVEFPNNIQLCSFLQDTQVMADVTISIYWCFIFGCNKVSATQNPKSFFIRYIYYGPHKQKVGMNYYIKPQKQLLIINKWIAEKKKKRLRRRIPKSGQICKKPDQTLN